MFNSIHKNTFKENFFLLTDSYKLSHVYQLPANTNMSYSYIESRGGKFDKTVFFGLQMFLKNLQNIFPTMADVEEALWFAAQHGVPFNYEGAKALVELGYFPIKITAPKEGMVIDGKNVLVTIENTVDGFAWLPSFIESLLLQAIWYPTTVATYSKECKNVIQKYMGLTSESLDGVEFMLQDFGFRGASSVQTAQIGGAAHLVNFKGSDTIQGIVAAMRYYSANVCGFSVVASEHSTITSHGKNKELDVYRKLIKDNPTGILSVVSDSYDIYNAVSNFFCKELKEEILARDGVFVVRPDSGNPVEIVFEVIEMLAEGFGYTVNEKGYKVLNPKVRVLQGDGIDVVILEKILENLKMNGWGSENMVFGMGGKLLQGHDRDTLKFAQKCSYIEVDGIGRDVFKDPITDKGKKSKKGRLALIHQGGVFKTIREEDAEYNLLEIVYENGVILRDQTFEEIRELSNSEFKHPLAN